ncbi:MAG: bifunctional glutamate N-acetyltransferase/amino-acid acetyltransferase ArgJ [Deltaproteobacteria bacterium]|nr:bifunctional glutamate N-acetyltransferase/amino-acid acetyltransferase ArgJ [Deltaproteobacteria bacterium]
MPVPGFWWLGENIGIKDTSLDFAVLYSEDPCQSAAMFTRSNMPGAPIIVGREHAAGGGLQAVVVNSKNANVATGFSGVERSRLVCELLGRELGLDPKRVLPSSTGVIGVPLPVEKIVAAIQGVKGRLRQNAASVQAFSQAIQTTDTRPKVYSCKVGGATLTAMAKGAGMIEPNMATMLAYMATDAAIPQQRLQAMLKRVADQTFNRVSVDSDTSTSDTVVVLANGRAGAVDEAAFEVAMLAAATHLARAIARDGEGATKLITLTVEGADSPAAALAFARSIINSPLVKTAVHGGDPNWGRFVMAVGKVFSHPVRVEDLSVTFGDPAEGLTIREALTRDEGEYKPLLARMSRYLKEHEEVVIAVSVGHGPGKERIWGCDLGPGYVEVNAHYTT